MHLLWAGYFCVAYTIGDVLCALCRTTLACSHAGATLYLEPAEVLELNNKEARLADEEQQAELAVLQVSRHYILVSMCNIVGSGV